MSNHKPLMHLHGKFSDSNFGISVVSLQHYHVYDAQVHITYMVTFFRSSRVFCLLEFQSELYMTVKLICLAVVQEMLNVYFKQNAKMCCWICCSCHSK
ncbi:hypothetical protein Syun_027415 [Stephania yunnanensis]|uniref:Uncharacterized protein n=1 Tax=Stephania yunnanensis TaxID=152371 RepID=A0AAP0HMT0_9MAGN